MLNLPNQLKIKKFTKKDITKKYLGILHDKKLLRYSDQRHKKHNYKSCLNYLNNFKNSDNLFLKIIIKKDLIGTCTVYIDKKNKKANIGFLLGEKKNQNKGYSTLILRSLIDYLFKHQINKVTCGTVSSNFPMIKVCKKNKMFLEATLKKEKYINSKFYDVQIYSKFNK
jgi:RimJ/RimL family protein N-acetyltransferase